MSLLDNKYNNNLNQSDFKELEGVCEYAKNMVSVLKDPNHKFHKILTKMGPKQDFKPTVKGLISVYIYDNKSRVLLYRNQDMSGTVFPQEKVMVPINGLSFEGENEIDSALRIVKFKTDLDVDPKNLIKIWSDNYGNVSFGFYLSESFDNIEFSFHHSISPVKQIKHQAEYAGLSKNWNDVHFCTYRQVTDLDNRYMLSRSNGLVWTLYRNGGSSAVYNGFQWLMKRTNDMMFQNASKYSTYVSDKQYDAEITSYQSLYWSVINFGLFFNKVPPIGKVGCKLSILESYGLHSYVHINCVPFIDKESKESIDKYIGNPNYREENGKLVNNMLSCLLANWIKETLSRTKNITTVPKYHITVV